MPKCGGTSFRKFLDSMFNLHADYHTGSNVSHPEKFKKYINKPVDLDLLGKNDCLVGHYNSEGIRLWQRYPTLNNYKHKKFTILRDPLETAISGVKFGIKRGWYDENMSQETKEKLLLGRASYFSQTLGIKTKFDIDDVMNKYWFIAPLDKLDLAARLIAVETGKEPKPVGKYNVTMLQDDFINKELQEKFIEEAALDTHIYKRCISRFEAMCQDLV